MLCPYTVNLQDDFLKIHRCSVLGNDQTHHFPPYCLVTVPNYFPEETEVYLAVFLRSVTNDNSHVCWWLAHTAETVSGGSLHPFPDPSLRDTASLSLPSEHLHTVF